MTDRGPTPHQPRTGGRLFVSIPVTYRRPDDRGSCARSLDLSPSGARLEVHHPLALGTRLGLDLGVPVQGVVVWCRKSWKAGLYEAGVAFSGRPLLPEMMARISRQELQNQFGVGATYMS